MPMTQQDFPQSGLQANIPRLYLLQACRWCMLIMPVIVLFFRENRLSMHQIMLLQAAYSLVLVACEVPSGYLSDTLGRRKCLVMGSALGAGGYLCYSLSGDFAGFLAAELLLGAGQSLISGTDSALLYECLTELGQEQRYVKTQGRMTACGNFSEAAAGIAGGLIALVSLRLNFYLQTAVMALAIPLALSLREPYAHRSAQRTAKWRDFTSIVSDTIHDRPLFWLIAHNSLILSATLTIVWFVQPWLQQANVPLALFGVAWTALNATVGAASLLAWRIERRISPATCLVLPLALVLCGFGLLSISAGLWSCLLFCLLYFARGFTIPVFSHRVNELVGSDRRATILSLRVLLTRLLFCVLGPAAGWLCDCFGLRTALAVCSAVFFLTGTMTVAVLLRVRGAPR